MVSHFLWSTDEDAIVCWVPGRQEGAIEDSFVIVVNIGEVGATTNFTYSYLPNPIVHIIEPKSSIL